MQQLYEAVQLGTLVRRKVFLSYYHGDKLWTRDFVNRFGGANGAFIPRVLGLDDDKINSVKPDYVIDTIREQYIAGSTVSIVLIGQCTHSRRFIDWEIKRGISNKNGLIGIMLPSNSSVHLPERFEMNYQANNSGYAKFYSYPESLVQLYRWIEDAYNYRNARDILVRNPVEPWSNNRICRACNITH
jgi:hypothetical protein